MSSEVVVRNNPEANRYEATIDGALVGIAEYQLTDQLIVFTHTEVEPAVEGHGVGGALARFALDDVAAQHNRKVLPLCPFIKAWIDKHPDYAHLVYRVPESLVGD